MKCKSLVSAPLAANLAAIMDPNIAIKPLICLNFLSAMKAAKMTTSQMEPLFPEDGSQKLADLALQLATVASGLAGKVSPSLQTTIGDLVRSMNCYYSNLIEGHNTHPVDIENALAGRFENDDRKRNLQLEAKAHIDVQRMIDRGEAPSPVVSEDFIRWVHRQFCLRLPPELLVNTNAETGATVQVIPGEYRARHVRVGRHVPVESEAIPAFMQRFVQAYGSATNPKIKRIIGVAASHHRLAWIHPFLDGNGRVTRLFSHAWLRELGIGSQLWSASRGLARTVDEYKARLTEADEPRRGALDGRGNLTQQGLDDFCSYFLKTCIDQVTFMESLLEPTDMLRRMEVWTQEEIHGNRLPKGAWALMREAVLAGEIPRGKVKDITGYEERQARTIMNKLLERGLLTSESSRGPLRLGFPQSVVERWLPLLYPAGLS